MESDGMAHRIEENSARSDTYISYSLSDAPTFDTSSIAADPESAWRDYLGLADSAKVTIAIHNAPEKPAASKPASKPTENASLAAPTQPKTVKAAPAKTASPTPAPTSGNKSAAPAARKKWYESEELAQNHRRDTLRGIATGADIIILLFLILYKLPE